MACSQTLWQHAEQVFPHLHVGFRLWALTRTPAVVGSVLICSCKDGGMPQSGLLELYYM